MLTVLSVAVIIFMGLSRADIRCVMDIMSSYTCDNMDSCAQRNQLIWNRCSRSVTNEYLAGHARYYTLSAMNTSSVKLYTAGIHPNSEYHFGLEKHVQVDAHDVCISEGAHLVYIETIEELNALNQFAQDYWKPTSLDYWTGAYRLPSETIFYWTPGNEVDEDEAMWFSGDPSRGAYELCVRLRRQTELAYPLYLLADLPFNT